MSNVKKPCHLCGGKGTVAITVTCTNCHGSGYINETICSRCWGTGKVEETRTCPYCSGTGSE